MRTRQHQQRKEIVWLYMVRYTMMNHQDAIDSSIACGEIILHIELQGLGDPMTHGPRTLNGHEQDESVSESERESESDTLPIIFNTRTNRRKRHNRVEAVPGDDDGWHGGGSKDLKRLKCYSAEGAYSLHIAMAKQNMHNTNDNKHNTTQHTNQQTQKRTSSTTCKHSDMRT